MRMITIITGAAAATVAAAAMTTALALPAHASMVGQDFGTGTTLVDAEQNALRTLHADYWGCQGPPIYYDEGGSDGSYYAWVEENCGGLN